MVDGQQIWGYKGKSPCLNVEKNCVVQSMLYGSPWDQAEVSLQLRPYLHLVPPNLTSSFPVSLAPLLQ